MKFAHPLVDIAALGRAATRAGAVRAIRSALGGLPWDIGFGSERDCKTFAGNTWEC